MAEAINALFSSNAETPPPVLSENEKAEVYAALSPFIRALCEDESLSALAMMDLVVSALHNAFPSFFWTGFYRRVAPSTLEVHVVASASELPARRVSVRGSPKRRVA